MLENQKENPVSPEELAISNMWELEALINVLVQNNLITKDELLEKTGTIYKKMNDILYHVNVLEMPGYDVWNLNILFSIV